MRRAAAAEPTQRSLVHCRPVPSTTNPETVVVKVTNYSSTTGIGTASYIGYSGGSCNGASFDSSGATEIASATLQFVVTDGGKQVEITFSRREPILPTRSAA